MERLLTTNEAATLLRLTPRTVAQYCKKGVLASLKVGKSYRIEQIEIRRFLGECANTPDRETPQRPQYSERQIRRAIEIAKTM